MFALDEYEVKPAKLPPLKIVLDTDKPIRSPLRPISLALRSQAEIEVKRLMDLDVIEHATEITPYHSPAFLIAKPGAKGDNTRYRVISDFRLVNRHIQKSVQALPDIESVTSLWKGCKYWSNLDLSLRTIKFYWTNNHVTLPRAQFQGSVDSDTREFLLD